MGTKTNPGEFDCYKNAEPDEPMFVLLARDREAPALVDAWAIRREQKGEKPETVEEAHKCAEAMREWRRENRPASKYALQCHCRACGDDFFVDSRDLEGFMPPCPKCELSTNVEILDVTPPIPATAKDNGLVVETTQKIIVCDQCGKSFGINPEGLDDLRKNKSKVPCPICGFDTGVNFRVDLA